MMMKKYIYLLIPIIAFSCKKDQEIASYDAGKSYAYFALENPDRSSSKTQLYIDSLTFSFAYEAATSKEKKIAIPVNIIGKPEDVDRRYSYTVDEKKTTIDQALLEFSDPIIRAGKIQDTLFITVRRGEVLKTASFALVLNMQPNESFELGHLYNTKIKLSIDDQLLEPEWWKRWVNVMGQYHREVYRLWMDIYYEGADPSDTGDENKPQYYWDNMPYSPVKSWYPVTFMYMDQLKKHLENNAVYPDGDTSKDRLYLP